MKAFLSLLLACAILQTQEIGSKTTHNYPKFEDYTVEVSHDKRVPLKLSKNERQEHWGVAMWNDRNKRVNFAGHYRISEASCGTECANVSIVDTKTGKYVDGFSLSWQYSYQHPERKLPSGFQFMPQSRLLIGSGCDEYQMQFRDSVHCGTFYWTMESKKLTFLQFKPFRLQP